MATTYICDASTVFVTTTIDQLCSGFLAAKKKKEEMTFFKNIEMLITRCFYFALGY